MKYLLAALLFLAGCGTVTKYRMKNCTQIKDNLYVCEQAPEEVYPRGGSPR